MLRSYRDTDYEQLKALYKHSEWYGGVYDEARDGRERLAQKIETDPEAILVYEENSDLKGTISIIEDGRVAMLYRFVVPPEEMEIAQALYAQAIKNLKSRGHTQVLVYSNPDSSELETRYQALGLNRGGDYSCFWVDI